MVAHKLLIGIGAFIVAVVLVWFATNQLNPRPGVLLAETAQQPEVQRYDTVLPPGFTPCPDLDLVPLYPGAEVLSTKPPRYYDCELTYLAKAHITEVGALYDEAFTKPGWTIRGSTKTPTSWDWSALYHWIDPDASKAGTAQWLLKLSLGLHPLPFEADLEDTTETEVTLSFHRYAVLGPVGSGSRIPVYEDAQHVQQKEWEQPSERTYTEPIMRVISQTFETRATNEAIAEFYNTKLLEHGWFFYHWGSPGDPSLGIVDYQTGSLRSEGGLYFRGGCIDIATDTQYYCDLHITASEAEGGSTRIEIRTEIYRGRAPTP
jgi:hypothetical protein